MTFNTGRWICFACSLLFCPILIDSQEAPPPRINATSPSAAFLSPRQSGLEEAYLPTLFRSSHAANLLKLTNGDLLCFWFSGTGEGESRVAIVMSRLARDSSQWSKTIEIDHQAGKSFQNPVAFQLSDGRIWLLHTSQTAGEGQADAQVLYLTSQDLGRTWTNPRPLFPRPGSFIRQPPVLIDDREWLLPLYYTPGRDITHGAESNYSAVEITRDGGKSWKECSVPESNGLVQQSVLRTALGRYLGFFRSRYSDFIYKSTSENGCNWTVPIPTQLPNNNSSIQAATLQDGSMVIAFNNSSSGIVKDKPRTAPRIPLSIALSRDGGQTWPWVRDIETAKFSGNNARRIFLSVRPAGRKRKDQRRLHLSP